MKEIVTEILINASVQKVWQVLMDFPEYPHWNPFIISIEGTGRKNEVLAVKMQTVKKQHIFRPKVLALDKEGRFEWLGRLPLGMFTGHHYFRLESLKSHQVRLVHGERFSGLLSGVILKKIGTETRDNFMAMNQALKNRVEEGLG